MTQEKLSELVEENMKTIFAYALSRVSNKEDAEDLAGDIILAILQSRARIRDDNAFFGYIWAIAANTYKKYLRAKSRTHCGLLDEELEDQTEFTLEILKSQEFHILRRELALLSREYRECTVAYYFEGLSCAETASRLHISLEMVKYYLFKTRKILKEGISMEREFGTKSYNPAKFVFNTIFSGIANSEYHNLFSRKLPGNILTSAYYTPMTIRELAIELGVASVYLEDEISLLEQYHLLTPLPGGKYQTHLVIFTEEYKNELFQTAEKSLIPDIGALLSKVNNRLPEIRGLGFPGAELEDNHLMWAFFFEFLRDGWKHFKSSLGKAGQEIEIYNGAMGVNYGRTYESAKEDPCDTQGFAGFARVNDHYAASYADFNVLPRKNRPSAHLQEIAHSLEAACRGDIKAMIPIVTAQQKAAVKNILQKETLEAAELYRSLYLCALSLMRVHAPKSMVPLIENVLANSLMFYTLGLMGACAVKSGALSIPEDDSPLGGFVYEIGCGRQL